MTERERYYDLGTRFVRLRMQFHRWIGLQPGEFETFAERLARLKAARARRAARRR